MEPNDAADTKQPTKESLEANPGSTRSDETEPKSHCMENSEVVSLADRKAATTDADESHDGEISDGVSSAEMKPAATIDDDTKNNRAASKLPAKKKARKKSSGSYRRRHIGSKPVRPLNAYNFFFREQRAKIIEERNRQDEGSQLSGAEMFSAMGKAVAQRWKELPSEERKKYEALAEEDKLRHREEMEEYLRWEAASAHQQGLISADTISSSTHNRSKPGSANTTLPMPTADPIQTEAGRQGTSGEPLRQGAFDHASTLSSADTMRKGIHISGGDATSFRSNTVAASLPLQPGAPLARRPTINPTQQGQSQSPLSSESLANYLHALTAIQQNSLGTQGAVGVRTVDALAASPTDVLATLASRADLQQQQTTTTNITTSQPTAEVTSRVGNPNNIATNNPSSLGGHLLSTGTWTMNDLTSLLLQQQTQQQDPLTQQRQTQVMQQLAERRTEPEQSHFRNETQGILSSSSTSPAWRDVLQLTNVATSHQHRIYNSIEAQTLLALFYQLQQEERVSHQHAGHHQNMDSSAALARLHALITQTQLSQELRQDVTVSSTSDQNQQATSLPVANSPSSAHASLPVTTSDTQLHGNTQRLPQQPQGTAALLQLLAQIHGRLHDQTGPSADQE